MDTEFGWYTSYLFCVSMPESVISVSICKTEMSVKGQIKKPFLVNGCIIPGPSKSQSYMVGGPTLLMKFLPSTSKVTLFYN